MLTSALSDEAQLRAPPVVLHPNNRRWLSIIESSRSISTRGEIPTRALAVILTTLAAFLGLGLMPEAANGKTPRYDKSRAQCRTNRDCLRDYNRRKECRKLPRHSKRQVRCWIRYAAHYYDQSVDQALDTAQCESHYEHDATSPSGRYKGIFQFDRPTWRSAKPTRMSRRRQVRVAANGDRKVTLRYPSRYWPKYAALSAMWYWSIGQRSRWPHCGYV